jgi:hypothetical protein
MNSVHQMSYKNDSFSLANIPFSLAIFEAHVLLSCRLRALQYKTLSDPHTNGNTVWIEDKSTTLLHIIHHD